MRKLAAVLFLAFLCSSVASAQYGELWFSYGRSLLSNADLGTTSPIGGAKDDVTLSDGFRFGFRMAFNGDTIFGHEVSYAYNRTQLGQRSPSGAVSTQGMAIHQGGYNFLVYATEEGTRVRPFATGGVQFSNYVPPGASATSGGGSNKLGFNYGGGVKMRVSGPWAVRFDVRQYTTPKPFSLPLKEGWIRQTEITGGVGFVF